MPSFCNPNDKPTIYYKFKGELAYRRVQIGVAPVDVLIEAAAQGSKSTLVFINKTTSFTISANSARNRLIFKALPRRLDPRAPFNPDVNGYATNSRTKQTWRINNFDLNQTTGPDLIFEGNLSPDSWVVDVSTFSNRWGSGFSLEYQEHSASNKAFLKISVGERLFFQTEGEEPNYEVCCGEECPKGFLKLPKLGKPGYCCIACSEIKAQTNQIKSMLR